MAEPPREQKLRPIGSDPFALLSAEDAERLVSAAWDHIGRIQRAKRESPTALVLKLIRPSAA